MEEEYFDRALKRRSYLEVKREIGLIEAGAKRSGVMAFDIVDFRNLLEATQGLLPDIEQGWIEGALEHENSHMLKATEVHGDNFADGSYEIRFFGSEGIVYKVVAGTSYLTYDGMETPKQRREICLAPRDPSPSDLEEVAILEGKSTNTLKKLFSQHVSWQ